jgi:hypothetical protein
MFADLKEPVHVRHLADMECESVFAAMRAGELDQPTAWGRVQAIQREAETCLAQLMSGPSLADIAALGPAPRWVASRLSDHQLAAAVLRDDGHYRAKVPLAIRLRVAECPATGGEAVVLLRIYLGG